MENLAILLLAVAIDLIMGEPPSILHPVVGMGKVASFLEKGSRSERPAPQFIYGAGLVVITTAVFAVPAYFLLDYLDSFNTIAYIITGALVLKSSFALRALRSVALRIKSLLVNEKLDEARFELRALVKRDTHTLTEPLLVSAAVESVSENASDSFVAPLFYFALFGVPGAIAYRAINTLDAMIGYRGKYEYLGKFAARLDDILNLVPARLTALLLVLASLLTRHKTRLSWQVALSDHTRTESPNAGWPMAAMAGALNVRLEKVGHYKLRDSGNAPSPETIDASAGLVYTAAFIWVALIIAIEVVRFVIKT